MWFHASLFGWGVEPKMRRKLKSCVNLQGALKQKKGVKRYLSCNSSLL
jgi:hypothetical protein